MTDWKVWENLNNVCKLNLVQVFVITLYEQYAFWGYCIYAQGDYFKKNNGLRNVFFLIEFGMHSVK